MAAPPRLAGRAVDLAFPHAERGVAPYLENEVLPRLGDACVAIDRSRPDWKARHLAEARAIAHWGGYEHNPWSCSFPMASRADYPAV